MTGASAYRPRLRAEVELEAGEAPLLRDRARDVDLPLTPWQERLLGLLDGTRTSAELANDLARAGTGPGGSEPGSRPRDPVEVDYFVKTLRYLYLTDDAPAAALARVVEARRDPAAFARSSPWQTLPDARFSCQMCGACCKNFALGPIRPADVERLVALPALEERFPHVRDTGRTVVVEEADKQNHYLPMRADGRCAYLLDDELCGIHAAYGGAQKPAMCHLFPTSVVLTVEGKHVFDRAECKSYGTSAFAGPSYPERVRELEPWLEESAEHLFFHPPIDLDGFLYVDYSLFLPFEAHLIAISLVEQGTVLDLLEALREASLHLLSAVAGADDATRSPEEVVRAVTSVPVALRYQRHAPAPAPRRGLGALADTYARAVEALERRKRDVPGRAEDPRGAPLEMAADQAALFDLRAAALCAQLGARGIALDRVKGSNDVMRIREAAAIPVDLADPRVDRRLRKLVRDVLFAKQYVVAGTWLCALLELGAILGAVLVGGRLRALAAGRREVIDHDFDDAQFHALKAFRTPQLRELVPRPDLGSAYLDGPALPLAPAT